MGSFRLTFVDEPPNDAQFVDKFVVNRPFAKQGPKSVNLLDGMGQDKLHALTLQKIGFLRTHLSHYHMHPRGHEAYFPSRRNALQRALEVCESLITLLNDGLKGAQGKTAADLKKTYEKVIKGVLATQQSCDAKINQLEQLEKYAANPNMTDLAGAVQGKLSAAGKELRGITADHLPEYFNPFHQYAMKGGDGLVAFNEWVELMTNARATGKELPAAFPIYLEGRDRSYESPVTYDGTGKDSEFYADTEKGVLVEWKWANGCQARVPMGPDPEFDGDFRVNGFVIDQNENLFVFRHVRGQTHHSSPTAGAPVICAGFVFIQGGKIHKVDDQSGHYAPTPRHLLTGLRILVERGVLADGATVHMVNAPGSGLFNIVALLAWADRSWTDEAARRDGLQQCLVSKAEDVSMDTVLSSFSPDYESDWYLKAEHLRQERLDMFAYNAPALRSVEVSKFGRQRSNAMRPTSARELKPLVPLIPLVPRGTAQAQAPAQASATPPTGKGRARGVAVRGTAPKF